MTTPAYREFEWQTEAAANGESGEKLTRVFVELVKQAEGELKQAVEYAKANPPAPSKPASTTTPAATPAPATPPPPPPAKQ